MPCLLSGQPLRLTFLGLPVTPVLTDQEEDSQSAPIQAILLGYDAFCSCETLHQRDLSLLAEDLSLLAEADNNKVLLRCEYNLVMLKNFSLPAKSLLFLLSLGGIISWSSHLPKRGYVSHAGRNHKCRDHNTSFQ